MRRTFTMAALLVATAAAAGGFSVTYLVPAFVTCPGPDTCGAPERESRFTFESATLRSAQGRYANAGKTALVVKLRGVKDETGALVSGSGFTVRLASGQVNLPSLGIALPAGHPLSEVPPVPIALDKGKGTLSYAPSQSPPAGTVVEGGGVTVYDSDGKRLATVGTQYR
jgi:hypothetical protein